MTDKRPAGDDAPITGHARPNGAPVTGVATGALGTAANLEDTQVFRSDELRAAAAAAELRRATGAPAAPRQAHPVRVRPSGPRRDRWAGLAGALAVAFVVLVAAAFMLPGTDRPATAPDQGARPTATAAPAAKEPQNEDARAGKGKGGGKGGGGNGRGNGNGNDGEEGG